MPTGRWLRDFRPGRPAGSLLPGGPVQLCLPGLLLLRPESFEDDLSVFPCCPPVLGEALAKALQAHPPLPLRAPHGRRVALGFSPHLPATEAGTGNVAQGPLTSPAWVAKPASGMPAPGVRGRSRQARACRDRSTSEASWRTLAELWPGVYRSGPELCWHRSMPAGTVTGVGVSGVGGWG